MLMVRPGERFEVPVDCPECCHSCIAEVDEWDAKTGIPAKDGLNLICSYEEEESKRSISEGKESHRLWLRDWQDVIDRAYGWIMDHIRISV